MDNQLQKLEERIKKLEVNQIQVTMTDNADQNVLRSVQRILATTNLSIGSSSTVPCALLALTSITKGLLFSNMTTAQKNAIVNPKSGLVVYDTTLGQLCIYTTTWTTLGGSGGGIAIGGIYMNTTGTNPATELGYGTWVAYGQGQVLVGYKSGDPDFGTGGATGGEKTHTLTIPEMPAHTHTLDLRNAVGATNVATAVSASTFIQETTSSTGGDGPHNNLQPFIVVFTWNRTA